MNAALLIALSIAAGAEDLDFAALPHYGPSREWVEKVANGLGRGRATAEEVEETTRLFGRAQDLPWEGKFAEAAQVAADAEWRRDCDAIAAKLHGRRASIPELFWWQRLG
ncbi:MAG TPA: hypothetical protein VNC50_19075, partial [Planctomycetia bacterium]|nr:hypothetical protein [Planctomycetia bacterium]